MLELIKNSPSKKWFILFSVSLGVFMCSLDATIVNVSLPTMTSYFNTSMVHVEWVVMIYLLTISSLLLTYGRLGDMYGHKPIYLCGFIIFTLASALNGTAPSIGYLIAFRALQALGAGMIMAVVQAIIVSTFDSSQRGQAMGINAVMVALGLASGPMIGGFLVSHLGWQSIFLVNIPVGILGILAVWLIVPYKKGTPQKFDYLGALTSLMFLSMFLLALSNGQGWGWTSPSVVGLFTLSIIFFIFFIIIEQKHRQPMIQLSLFRNRLFLAANIASMLNYLTQYVVVFIMPFYLINLVNMPTNKVGLIMGSFPLMAALVAPFSGSISDKIGSRTLTSLGMSIIAVGIFMLSSSYVLGSSFLISLCLGLVGLGAGTFQAPNNSAIMGSVPESMAGIGSGMVATMRSIGQVLGVAVCGAVFSYRSAVYSTLLKVQGHPLEYITHQSFQWAVRDTYIVAGFFAFLGVIICLIRGNANSSAKQVNILIQHKVAAK